MTQFLSYRRWKKRHQKAAVLHQRIPQRTQVLWALHLTLSLWIHKMTVWSWGTSGWSMATWSQLRRMQRVAPRRALCGTRTVTAWDLTVLHWGKYLLATRACPPGRDSFKKTNLYFLLLFHKPVPMPSDSSQWKAHCQIPSSDILVATGKGHFCVGTCSYISCKRPLASRVDFFKESEIILLQFGLFCTSDSTWSF